jgi:hypothetical protein
MNTCRYLFYLYKIMIISIISNNKKLVINENIIKLSIKKSAVIAPAVERVIGNDEVTGSNPVDGTNFNTFKVYYIIETLMTLIVLYLLN